MPFFGVPIRNGLPIGLGSVAGFGVQQFDPSLLFEGGTVPGAWYDPSDLSTMFTTSAGTTPVAMPGQGSAVSVGLMLDKRAPAYSVYFDGTGDYLTVPSSAAFQFGTGDFTIECWINKPAAANGPIVDARGSATAVPYAFYIDASNFPYFYDGTSSHTSSVAVVNNQWNHVAVVRTLGTLKIFVNGVEGYSATNAISLSPSATVYVGGQNFGGGASYTTGYISNVRVVKGTAVYTGAFTPPTAPLSPISGTSLLTCGTTWSGNPAITSVGNTRVDGLNPFTASPVGNHAISINDSTARPELRARVNLLTYSEEFDNGAWLKVGGAVSANSTLAPDGTTTADTFTATAAFNRHCVINTGAPALLPANTPVVFSAYIKKGNYNFVSLLVTNTTTTWFRATFDFSGASPVLSQSANGAGGTYISASVEAAANGFWRLVVRGSTTDTTLYGEICLNSTATPPSQNYGEEIWTAVGTETVIIWGADLRPANIGANVPAYQRIADSNTYDTAGFPLYLRFDGIDDGLYTPANLNLSATDKVGVFAGVRKLVAGTQQLVELSISVSTNDGSFSMPSDSGTGTWATASKGTNPIVLAQSATNSYVAPVTTVNTGLHDLSLAADVARLRVNGAQVATSGVVAAGGNFGTYPLNIGVRSATSSPTLYFNGHLHGLIVVGSAVSAGNISATESWMAGKTGIVIP